MNTKTLRFKRYFLGSAKAFNRFTTCCTFINLSLPLTRLATAAG
ncbi:MAG: hypothetical protein ACI9WS_001524 [Paraglaciecola psychrophila]|jgi:hypothetical protein